MVADFDSSGALASTRTPAAVRVAPGSRLDSIRLEHLLYAAIFLLAVLTRFWDLSSRAFHHDESLHSYYSWVYAEGGGHQHNPLMHGPFLFHANALMYLIVGSGDYVSRVMPAVAGVILVMLPWLLRGPQFLGRWGALMASGLLLISPSILYYSRFIRHDIYCLLGTIALAIAVLRFIEHLEPRWAIFGGVTIGFLVTTEEVSFIVFFIFATFIALAVALRSAPVLIGIGGGAAVLFAVLDRLLHARGSARSPAYPGNHRPPARSGLLPSSC